MEGVAVDGFSRILVYAKENHGLTESTLNAAINEFRNSADPLEKYNCLPLANFKYSSKTKTFIASCTASQTRTLLSRLPFIFNLMNLKASFFESTHYKCFSLLVKIGSFAYSPCLHVFDVNDFKVLIEKYLSMTVSLSLTPNELAILSSAPSNCKERLDKVKRIVKPKAHNMIHYPYLIYENGPLRYSSTLCHERSMSKYKLVVHSKLNPTLQIASAMRLQMINLVRKSSESCLTIKEKMTDLSSFKFPNLSLDGHGIVFKKLKFENMLLADNLCILKSSPSNYWLTSTSPPLFAKIVLIYTTSISTFIVVENMKTVSFCRRMMAYNVESTNIFALINVKEIYLKKTFSFHTHSADSTAYVIPESLPYKEY